MSKGVSSASAEGVVSQTRLGAQATSSLRAETIAELIAELIAKLVPGPIIAKPAELAVVPEAPLIIEAIELRGKKRWTGEKDRRKEDEIEWRPAKRGQAAGISPNFAGSGTVNPRDNGNPCLYGFRSRRREPPERPERRPAGR